MNYKLMILKNHETRKMLLNIIVNEKSSICEKKDIEFTYNINFVKIVFLESIDVSAIFDSIPNEILLKKNRLLTTKVDKFTHGLGILSIESVLKKYNGKLIFKEFEGGFRILIHISLNKYEREVEV